MVPGACCPAAWLSLSLSALLSFTWALPTAPHVLSNDLCAAQGWEPYEASKNATRPRKVYDLFMINTELDWLEIRLNTSYSHVDYFVIVEAPFTFTGKPKELFLKNNMKRPEIARYANKIILHELTYPKGFDFSHAWNTESHQRNAMLTQVFPTLKGEKAPREGDAIVVADLDEILRPETYDALRECAFPRRLTLWVDIFYYSFQWRVGDWHHPQATYYSGSVNTTIPPESLRMGHGVGQDGEGQPGNMARAGWHCSWCLPTMAEMLTKITSFSHSEFDKEEHKDPHRMAELIRNGRDIFDRGGNGFTRVENNTDVPKYILQDPKRFRYLLDRDGPSAGFSDYPWNFQKVY